METVQIGSLINEKSIDCTKQYLSFSPHNNADINTSEPLLDLAPFCFSPGFRTLTNQREDLLSIMTIHVPTKEERFSAALEAAEVGRYTRLNESIVESVAQERNENIQESVS